MTGPLLLLLAQTIAFRGGVLHAADGRALRGAAVVVRDGKIAAAGEGAEIPPGCPVVELPEASHLTAGFIDLHSHLGMSADLDEPALAATPQMRAADGFSSDRDDVRAARSAGVTLVALAPGEANVVGGAISLVRLRDGMLDRMLVEPVTGLKLCVSPPAVRRDREPTSLAGALELLERELSDPGSETHRRLVRERRPALVRALHGEEIAAALRLKAAFGVRVVLLHAPGSDEAAEAIAAAGVPVVLGPLRLSDGDRDLRRPAVLAKAGVRIGFASDAPRVSEEQLRRSAILATAHGLPAEAALRALTSDAARILGIEERAGAIEPGKDADLVVYSADPLSAAARVERVVAGGAVVYERSGR